LSKEEKEEQGSRKTVRDGGKEGWQGPLSWEAGEEEGEDEAEEAEEEDGEEVGEEEVEEISV